MIVKYLWSACGYCLISIPVFFAPEVKKLAAIGGSTAPNADAHVSDDEGRSIASRTENYISNRRLLLALADAGGRLMYSWKDIAELAGYTSRVFALLSTLHELDAGNLQTVAKPADWPADKPFYDLGHINGKTLLAPARDGLALSHVPIVAPAPGLDRGGEELIRPLDIKIAPGEHVMITGPNGSGKTSVVRVLAGLWPAFAGTVQKPIDRDIFYLPQRPYLSAGSLRDQSVSRATLLRSE